MCLKQRPAFGVMRGGGAGNDAYGSGSRPSRQVVLETVKCTVVDYLDAFEDAITNHIAHKVLRSACIRSDRDLKRNRRPGDFERNIDFAENGNLNKYRQIQSEYWTSTTYSLPVSVWSWLSTEEWNSETSELPVGSEVTVNGEKAHQTINQDAFWARVESLPDADGYILVVRQDQTTSTHHRRELRHRKRISLVYGGVSEDKCHYRHHQQEFTLLEEKVMEKVIKENFPGDVGPEGKITKEYQHSDNATQHFKSTGAIEFLTDQFVRRGGRGSSCCFTKAVGCRGHGKGEWDGIGGAIKGVVTAHNRRIMVRLSSDVGALIQSPLDEYKYLRHHYDPDRWRRANKKTGVSQGRRY
mmetsp:Transcript_22840/g.33875  ORF Transcript_22840/g.33875 Transcript_22840/m.33875 type:complete len:355 (-) Transcript_22840:336-1400(-)